MKKILCLIIIIAFVFCLISCGNNAPENNKEQYAILRLPNGEIVEGECNGYARWSSGYMEIRIGETTYYTHEINVTIIERQANED